LMPPRDLPVVISEPEPDQPPPSAPIQHARPLDANHATAPTTEPFIPATATVDSDPNGLVTPDPGPPTISNPHWLQTPRDLARYYPIMALRREIEGAVQLDCLVTTTGALQCAVVSETPASWGFGAAAIRIAQDYRMVPATRDGAPIEARYRMRVPFRLH